MSEQFDAVVFLTWTDWHTEPRSNRYHYAIRFARRLPVIFVQPDIEEHEFRFEEIGIDNIVILHLWKHYDYEQGILLNLALEERGVKEPLLWVYNYNFAGYVYQCGEFLCVYHATEDYFCDEFVSRAGPENLKILKSLLMRCDLVIAVSDPVAKSYVERGGYKGEVVVVSNGCDYNFWTTSPNKETEVSDEGNRIVFYQGGINSRLNFSLLHEIVRKMPEWLFWFCGRLQLENMSKWNLLNKEENVKYYGELEIEEVRDLAYRSTVGIMPYKEESELIKVSFPLKAFEYAACGLGVVSIPITSLEIFAEIFSFAQTADQFVEKIEGLATTRYDSGMISVRRSEAKKQDYDLKFESVWSRLCSMNTLDPDRLLELLRLSRQYSANFYQEYIQQVHRHKELLDSKAVVLAGKLNSYPFLRKVLFLAYYFLAGVHRVFKRLFHHR